VKHAVSERKSEANYGEWNNSEEDSEKGVREIEGKGKSIRIVNEFYVFLEFFAPLLREFCVCPMCC